MQSEIQRVQRAIDDIALVKKAIDAGRSDSPGIRSIVDGTNVALQLIALLMALLLVVLEVSTDHVNSYVLQASANDARLGLANIILIGLMLTILVVYLYFIVYRASKKSQSDFRSFVARNFSYLRSMSLLSDLGVKFALVALLVHVGQPQWIAPLLFLFIGDFLLQGRFFTLSLRLSLLFGMVCFAAALLQAYAESGLLVWPLCGFVAVCAISLLQLLWRRKVATTTSTAVQ